jgi:2-C-methyl-D-erythritol 4-phosphate cytidylyltransferase
VAVVVPAAGRGERLGGGLPKALRPLAGEPLLVHAVRTLAGAPSVDRIVVAGPRDQLDVVVDLVRHALGDGPAVTVVAGGESRQESVAAGLAVLDESVDVVLVHDAARALVPVEVVERVVAGVRAGADAVVPVVDVTDTVRRVLAEGGSAVVDRAGLRIVQTPQGFPRHVLVGAHERARRAGGEPATDDAVLVERAGGRVTLVEGSTDGFKITHPADLAAAEALLTARGSQ